ncbi:MAG: hypothetical protein ACREJA_03270, partial [Candidatus Methylomirabilales bacterium]
SSELERAEVDIPDALIDFLEPNILGCAGDGDVDPLAIPANATVGTDVTHLEAVGVFEGWKL